MGNRGTAALGGIKTHIRRNNGDVRTTPMTRYRMKVSALVRRLHEHCLGRLTEDGKRVYPAMTMTQLRAAEMLLARAMPTLAAVEMDVKGEIGHYDISDKPLTIDEWEREAQEYLEAAIGPSDPTH